MLTGAEFTNGPQVARAIASVGERASDAGKVAAELAAIGLDAARREAPRRTGTLAASLATDVGQNEAELGTDVGYAPFVEFGTVYMPGVRFIGAGYEAMKARAEGVATPWMEGILADADKMA